MSLFGGFMGDDDMFLGNPMQAMNMQMRSMNRLMNSIMPDPFNMLSPFDTGFQQNSLMERNAGGGGGQMGLFGFPAMPNINRLLNADIGAAPNGASYCSSSVITMSSGPDGRPQIYQATSSTKTGPGGIRETRKTVQDSTRGIKKMAIGHHIGERAHIIEKEQDLGSGQLEERQEFINLDEEEAEDFDREFTSRAQTGGRTAGAIGPNRARQVLSIEPIDDDYIEESGSSQRRQLPALPAPVSHHQPQHQLPQSNQQNSSTTTTPQSANTTPQSATPSNSEKPVIGNTTIDLVANTNDDDDGSDLIDVSSNNTEHNNAKNNSNNNLGGPPTRCGVYHHRNHHLSAIAPRRPLRTPPSSPLATTASSLSVHPHPYNVSAARRNYRPKHTKQHQHQHQQHHSIANGHANDEGKKLSKHSKK